MDKPYHKLTVVSPCFNEIRFIKAWLENCRCFADHVVISEGGSIDGTLDIIKEYQAKYPDWITMEIHEQIKEQQELHRHYWNEPFRRQWLVDQVKEGYIVFLDVDEMLPDDFRTGVGNVLDLGAQILGQWLHFWRSVHYIRVNYGEEKDFGITNRAILFPANTVTMGNEINHSKWHCSAARVKTNIPKFHFHYLCGKIKSFENRYNELMDVGPLKNENILLRRIRIPIPSAIKYIEETVNWGDADVI